MKGAKVDSCEECMGYQDQLFVSCYRGVVSIGGTFSAGRELLYHVLAPIQQWRTPCLLLSTRHFHITIIIQLTKTSYISSEKYVELLFCLRIALQPQNKQSYEFVTRSFDMLHIFHDVLLSCARSGKTMLMVITCKIISEWNIGRSYRP